MLIKVLFSQETVLTNSKAMIRGIDYVGILIQARFLQTIENPSDLLVHVGDDGIVFLPVNFDGMLGPWHRGQFFIPQAMWTLDFIAIGILG